jgi:uncharacterized protein (DUF1330 family)
VKSFSISLISNNKEEKMAAYLIGHITIKDPVKWEKYVNGVQESLAPFEANIIFRGKRVKVFTGEHPYHNTVVIEFSDPSAMQQWYSSENYQKLIPLRDEAADVVIIGYDT